MLSSSQLPAPPSDDVNGSVTYGSMATDWRDQGDQWNSKDPGTIQTFPQPTPYEGQYPPVEQPQGPQVGITHGR